MVVVWLCGCVVVWLCGCVVVVGYTIYILMDFPIFSHCKGSIASRDFPRLDELMRRGVPAQQRAEIWFEISGAQELQQRYQEMYVTRMAEMYGNLR